MAQRSLGVGLIGAGHIVKEHATAYRSLGHAARLVAVADIDPNRAKAAKDRFGFEHALTDHRELLQRDDVEVVDICTPAGFHAPLVIGAIEAGKHVLCEKPMATTLADADAMIRAAEQHPRQTVSFVFQLRRDATHVRMRKMIEKGHIGRPLSAALTLRLRKQPAYYRAAPGRGSWKTDGGGVLINQAIHQLDALISFLGEPVEVSAVMDTFVQPTEGEDTIAGWVRFRSGAIASIDCTVCAPNKFFSIDVTGEAASMRVAGKPDANAFDWQVKTSGSAAQRAIRSQGYKLAPSMVEPPSWKVGIEKLICKARKRLYAPPRHWGHTPLIEAFLAAVRNGSQGPMPPREARRSLELTAALYESALTRRTVSLPLGESSSVYKGVRAENIREAQVDSVLPGKPTIREATRTIEGSTT